jgi:hypothetical protein
MNSRYLLALGTAWCVTSISLFAGCGGGGLEPVSGKVSNGTNPLANGTVTFHPDSTKGNESTKHPEGLIEADGTYTLYTDQAEGAPAGWYKVTVFAETPAAADTEGAAAYATPDLLVGSEYTIEAQTPLSIEVKSDAAEGAYDLTLNPPN